MDRKQRGNAILWILLAVILGVVGYFVRDASVGVTLEEVTPETKFERAIADNLIAALETQKYLPKDGDCCWPKMCEDPEQNRPTTYAQLREIYQWIEAAQIDPGRKDRLREHVVRSLDPELMTKEGIHVCQIQEPARDPCDELFKDIYTPASTANEDPDPEAAWQTVENEFEQFPGDR